MIRKTYDPQADAFYVSCATGKVATTQDKGDYLVDYDCQGKILGYEILNYCEVVQRLTAIDGIPLTPPWEATVLGTTDSKYESAFEIAGSRAISVDSTSRKAKASIKQVSDINCLASI